MASLDTPGAEWDAAAQAYRVRLHAAARHTLADAHLDTARDDAPPVASCADPARPLEFLSSWFSRSSRDRHLPIKRGLAPHFAASQVQALGGVLGELADQHAATLPANCDLARDYLRPFVLSGSARLLGVSAAGEPTFAKAVTALSAVLGRPTLDEQALAVVSTCIRYLRQLMTELLRQDRPRPLVAALCRLVDSPTHEESFGVAVSTLAQVLTAGFHPTVTGAAFAWRALYEQPALLASVRSKPENLQRLVEEVLRLEPPFPYVHRWAHAPCACLDVAIPIGAHVIVDLRAANRDERVYPNASRIELERDAGPGLSFGHGPHRCLAPALAQLQIAVSLRALLALPDPPWPVASASSSAVGAQHLVLVPSLPCSRRRPEPEC